MEFIKELLFVTWFFAPAGIANIAAFGSGKIPTLKRFNYPVDFGFTFRGKRILGHHKTYRGFLVGIIAAILTVALEVSLYTSIDLVREVIVLDYAKINPLLLGFLLGFGALFGDAVKSFFKRQIDISPGKSWVPFDQIDYILGGIMFSAVYVQLSEWHYFILIVWFLILHPLHNIVGYLLKLKKELL